jgi:hypothetical protein
MVIHAIYGVAVLFYTFYALYQRNQIYIFLGQLVSSLALMHQSFKYAKENARKYPFINQ